VTEAGSTGMRPVRSLLIWAALVLAVAAPLGAAAMSPLLAWRDPVYIVAGFAGVVALGLLLVQPMLMSGILPGLSAYQGRRLHRWTGGLLVLAVVIHVGGLWITSPPDVMDALLLASPTPFSMWGVVALWAVLAVALLATLRHRLRLSPQAWRIGHMVLAVVIILGAVVHALLIEGTMETVTKIALCALVLAALIKVLADLRGRVKRSTSR
jgi:predicted ferric reductase